MDLKYNRDPICPHCERLEKVAEGVHVDEYGNGQICDAAAAIRGRK